MGDNGRRWADETFSAEKYANEMLQILIDASTRGGSHAA
jgi:hypothetical protein